MPQGVAERFPEDKGLRTRRIEGYVGVGLYDSRKQPMGIMAAMYTEPIRNLKFAESILQIFAARTSSEIERMRSEEALRLAEFSVDRTSDAVFWIAPDARINRANEAACRILGYSEEELLEMTVHDIDPNFPTSVWPQHWQELKERGSMIVRSNHRVKDGRVFPVEISLNYLEYEGREYNFAFARDITDRKKSEAALRRSEATLSSILRATPSGIGIVSDRVITWANDQLCAMVGYEREELVGESARILYPTDEDFEYVGREKYAQILERGTGTVETRWQRKDGQIRAILLSSTPLAPDNLSVGITFTALDITQRKQLEDQLRHAAKMEAVGTLAGGIAHDFNNLLQVIQGYAEMAQFSVPVGQPGYSDLQEIRKAAKSAADLTQGLLTFSRSTEGSLRPVNPNAEVQMVAKMLSRTIPRMIAIQLDLTPGIDTIHGDPSQLQQLMMNLAVNSRDAMPEGGTLLIETRNTLLGNEFCQSHPGTSPGRYVLLAVRDNGCGMDRATVARIFEPFFTTKELGAGTGLGLSIAYGVVKSHGGSIVCHSQVGVGTTFEIYLPSTGAGQSDEGSELQTDLVGGTETILLVEDEESIRRLGQAILTKFGYSVLSASNGREGLEIFGKNRDKIALVILDLVMPQMGGRECLREIMKLDASMKVIIASGFASNGQNESLHEEGARVSIRKPYETRQLIETVRRVLDTEVT
jgi:two-component system cell cycle sensor histidine kinase/response regulator CckA